jgi:hypothetical protein
VEYAAAAPLMAEASVPLPTVVDQPTLIQFEPFADESGLRPAASHDPIVETHEFGRVFGHEHFGTGILKGSILPLGIRRLPTRRFADSLDEGEDDLTLRAGVDFDDPFNVKAVDDFFNSLGRTR